MKFWFALFLSLVVSVPVWAEARVSQTSKTATQTLHLHQVCTVEGYDYSYAVDGNWPSLLYEKRPGRSSWIPDLTFAFRGISIEAIAVDQDNHELLLAGRIHDSDERVWIRRIFLRGEHEHVLAQDVYSSEMPPDFAPLAEHLKVIENLR